MNTRNRIIIFLIAWLMPMAMLAQTNHWTPVSAPYEDNMSLTGVIQINGVEQQSTALEVGAFCGTECRGSARPVLFPVTGRYVFSLTIFGNDGDQITFKLYDHSQGTELNLQSPAAVTFGPNGLGSPLDPYVLNFTAVYTISASANPSAGGTVGGGGTYNYGSTCTLTATPATGYNFVRWTKNGSQVSTNASYSFTVTENASYVAVFNLKSYTISASANPSAGGSVSGGGTYNHGSTCTLTATANTGYTFTNWTKNGTVVSTSANYSFTVTGGGTYVANFSPNSYTISVSANPSSGGTVSGGGTYNYGSTCTLIATPATGYNFVRWTKNGSQVSTSASYSFTVTENASYVAVFSLKSYTISASASPSAGGSVSGAGTYNHGSTCTLTATTNTGYTFMNWTKNGSVVSTNANYSFTVTGSGTYVANFIQNTYTISASANPSSGGTVSGGGSYNYGSTCNLTATPATGYNFVRWTKNGTQVSTSASYSFTVTENASYVAVFSLKSYTISASASPTAGGSVSGAGTYDHGSTCTLTATPATGYNFVRWTKNGSQVSTSASYSFTVTANASYVAVFSLNSYTISASASPTTGGSVSGAGTYNHGSTCTMMATANEGYVFTNWTENGDVVSIEAEYSFTVNSNRDLVANFVDPNIHYYVDLGLPSGLLWATCNVGAYIPEAYGDHFAWGETQPKSTYTWSSYQYCNGSYNKLTKYCTNSSYGNNGFTDNLTLLLPEDDAATANWGNDWRMPTKEEWQELYDNTTCIWTTQNGVDGRLFTAANGNSLFLPAAGFRSGGNLNDGTVDYWSNTLCQSIQSRAWEFYSVSGNSFMDDARRYLGLSVRAVQYPYHITVTQNFIEGGNVSGGGSYQQGQNCTVTATANTGYIFINWTENGNVVSTGAEYTFIVNSNRDLVANFVETYVDLGLPSGTLWASCNVGADTPEGYGDHFAWGETQPKSTYTWSSYQYCNGSYNKLTKYCTNSSYGNNGFTDNLTLLLPEDDAATANWGNDWRMPTKEEWQELYDNTTCIWTTQNGVDGRLFTAANGNSLFLPAAGFRSGGNLNDGTVDYWSNTLCQSIQSRAWEFYSVSGNSFMDDARRYLGLSVRAVRNLSNITQTIALTAGTNWFSTNVEITMSDLQAALLAAYPNVGMNDLVIKSKGDGQTAYNPVAQRWIGSLTTLDLSQMYMVKVPTDGEISVEGMPIDPAEHPAVIAPGANWIAFPLGQSMSITDAFAGFPANGDIVKAKGGGQAQWNSAANRWIGALVNAPLQPGQGYMYNSKSTGNRTFTFPVSAK